MRVLNRLHGERAALFVGGAIFVAGFGAMNLFWFFGAWRRDVPGLWDYRSATVGDGLLLPVAAAILIGAGNRLPQAPQERPFIGGTAVVGAICGTVLQVAWLQDPHPQLNWTIPQSHVFNAPGWYHAGFLVAASGFFAGAMMRVLWRARQAERTGVNLVTWLDHPATAVLVGCLIGFFGLAARDGMPSLDTRATVSSLATVGLAMTVLALLARWGFGRALIQAWKVLVTGLLLAIVLWTIPWRGQQLTKFRPAALLVIALLILPIIVQFWAWYRPYWRLHALICGGLLANGVNLSLLVAPVTRQELAVSMIPILLAIVAVGFTLDIVAGGEGPDPEARILASALAVPCALLLIAAWLRRNPTIQIDSDIVESVFGFAFVAVLVVLGKLRYQRMLTDEEHVTPGRPLEASFWATWSTLICVFTAAVAALILVIAERETETGIDVSHAASSPFHSTMAIGAFIAASFSFIAVGYARPQQERPSLIRITPHQPPLGSVPRLAPPAIWSAGWQRLRRLAPGADAVGHPYDVDGEPDLHLTPAARPWAFAAALVWLLWPLVAWQTAHGQQVSHLGPDHFRLVIFGIAAVTAVWFAINTTLSLVANIGYDEFFRFGAVEWILAIVGGLAMASSVVWLLAIDVWAGGRPAALLSVAASTVIVTVGSTLVVTGCGIALARSASRQAGAAPHYLDLHHPATNTCQDNFLHGFLLAFAVVVLLLTYRLTDAGIAAWLGILLAVFPLVTAFGSQLFFTRGVYDQHLENELLRGYDHPEVFETRVVGGRHMAQMLNRERMRRVRERAVWINQAALALCPPVLIWSKLNGLVRWYLRWVGQGGEPDPLGIQWESHAMAMLSELRTWKARQPPKPDLAQTTTDSLDQQLVWLRSYLLDRIFPSEITLEFPTNSPAADREPLPQLSAGVAEAVTPTSGETATVPTGLP